MVAISLKQSEVAMILDVLQAQKFASPLLVSIAKDIEVKLREAIR